MRTDNAIPLDAAPSLDGALILIVDDQEEARMLLRLALEVRRPGDGGFFRIGGAGCPFRPAGRRSTRRPDSRHRHAGRRRLCGASKVREWEAEQGVPQSKQIPAIALTAFGRSEDRLRALAAGFRMHVAKPVEPLELAIVVSSVIGARPK